MTQTTSGVTPGNIAVFSDVNGDVQDGGVSIASIQSGEHSGTVTSVSVVAANGVSGTVANPTTTPALTLSVQTATNGQLGLVQPDGTSITISGGVISASAPVPSRPFATVWVSQDGNDTTGNGNIEKPYATIAAALASITDNSSTKPYVIQVQGGIYAETALAIKPWVSLNGTGSPAATTITTTSDISLDASWTGGGEASLSNIVFGGSHGLALNATGMADVARLVRLSNCDIHNNIAYTGSTVGGGGNDNIAIWSCILGGTLTLTTTESTGVNNTINGNVTLNGTAGSFAVFLACNFAAAFTAGTGTNIYSAYCDAPASVTLTGPSTQWLPDVVSYLVPTLASGATVTLQSLANGLDANHTPVHYTTAGVDVTSNIAGIDTALGTKQGTLTLTTTGTSGAATLSGSTLNIPDYATGSGTVTSASVVSANGLAGTVANPTTTPAITLSTTVTGLVKGNGTALSAATAGTDYQAPVTLTTTGTSGAATFSGNTLNIPNYATGSGTVTTVSVVSANGMAGTVANPTTTPAITLSTSITGVLKGNGTAISAASAGTDYQAPVTLTTTGASGAATFSGGTLNVPNYTAAGLGAVPNTITVNGHALSSNVVVSASDITTGTLPAAQLPLATTSAFGAVKPDGTTITISAGVISASGGSGPTFIASSGTATAGGGSSLAAGPTASSPGASSVAIGDSSTSNAAASVAIGNNATVSGGTSFGVAIGRNTTAGGTATVVVGNGSSTGSTIGSVAIGASSTATGGTHASVSIGNGCADNSNAGCVSIGDSMSASGANQINIGNSVQSIQLDSNGTFIIPARAGRLIQTTTSLTDGSSTAAGTLLNAPTAGNPTKWIPIDDNGTQRFIPCW